MWGITDSEDKLFLSAMCDKCDRSEKTHKIIYTRFLTPRQVILIKDRLSDFCRVEFFGGYEGADRLMAAFLPEYAPEPEYPICAAEITDMGKRELSHRDYMGSILGLGISRELVGDIVVTPKGATVLLCREIADFVEMNLTKVGSSGIKLAITDNTDSLETEKQFKEIGATVSSMRIDCIVSAATGKSRSAALSYIREGIVSVNYDVVKSPSLCVGDGDVISVRGFGKMKLATDLNLTKKGRIYVKICKYI